MSSNQNISVGASPPPKRKLDWNAIIPMAILIANSYATSVTLRQLHYRLVAANIGGYENDQGCYKLLSSRTAELRRQDVFPKLSDRTRGVVTPPAWASPAAAVTAVLQQYRRDRTEDQEFQTWVLYEKATLGAQIEAWTSPYGIPTAALRGYSSESLEREIFDNMENDGRDVVVFYVGDLDPEGEDIERNFLAQFDRADINVTLKVWEKLTVLVQHIQTYGLVPNPGKSTSSRAAGFVAKYGTLFQIEVEAMDPAELERLVVEAITDPSVFDKDKLAEVLKQEAADKVVLKDTADDMEDNE